jgi:hypothetical protein
LCLKIWKFLDLRLIKKWQEVEKNEVRFTEYYMDDAKIAVVGFGLPGVLRFRQCARPALWVFGRFDQADQLEPLPVPGD